MTTATAKSRARAKKATQKKGSATKPTKPGDERATRRKRQLEKLNTEFEQRKAQIKSQIKKLDITTEKGLEESNHLETLLTRVAHAQLHAQDHLIEMVPPGFFDGKRDLSKTFTVIAKNIEDSLVKAGAEAGVDYTYLDLYKLAAPFILVMFQDKDADEISFDADNF
jgi:hypothetical protein